MILRTDEKAIKTNSTVLLDHLKQASQVFNRFSLHVEMGLHTTTEKFWQVAEELRKQQ